MHSQNSVVKLQRRAATPRANTTQANGPVTRKLALEASDDAARVQSWPADGRMVRRCSVAADAVHGPAVAAKDART